MTMTTKLKRKAPAAATVAKWAAMDFEPWQGEVAGSLPNNEQFTEAGLFGLITCRMALVMMYMTKAKLSEMFEQSSDAMVDLVENMETTKNFFSSFSELLEAASARLHIAMASVYQNTPDRD